MRRRGRLTAQALWHAGAVGICLGSILAAGRARADGAFPGSSGIVAPASRPHEILLGTNFGVVTSIDDGQTWTYACERDESAFGSQYQLGAPPQSRLYALSDSGFVFSDNGGCSWGVAGGAIAGDLVNDAFPDPTNVDRVLAIGSTAAIDGGSPVVKVFASTDGGKTFGTTLYTASGGDNVTGIEVARSSPSTVYMTMLTSTFAPKLGRSADGGNTWMIRELAPVLGADVRSVRLIAIDPDKADRLFLRAGLSGDDRLVVSDDGGVTARTALDLHGVMRAFVRTPSGRLIVAGTVGVTPVAFLSTDDAQTFQPLPAPPNLIGLAARGGNIYGLTDTQLEDYALFISTDEGTSWQPLMAFADIQAIAACAKAQCQDDCQMRADIDQWPAEMCAATPAPKPVDGGDSGSDGGAGGGGASGRGGAGGVSGQAGAAGDASDASGAGGKSGAGCHCTVDGGSRPGTPLAAVALAAVFTVAALRQRRRRWGRLKRQ